MSHQDLTANDVTRTLSGLTRLLLVLFLAPGVMAGAAVAGVLAVLVWPVMMVTGSGRHPGRWLI
jgi:hypothetical protein